MHTISSKTGTPAWLRRSLLCLAVLLLCLSPSQAQRGAITYPRNLVELTAQAAVIVHGRVMAATVEPDPQFTHLNTVLVTVHVEEALKGKTGETFTFREFLWDWRDVHDAAGYSKGQEVVLLMNAPTSYGLSSPAGLEQGRFRVLRDAKGNRIAINARGNQGLFRGVAAAAQMKGIALGPRLTTAIQRNSGPVPLDDLRELIRKLAGGN